MLRFINRRVIPAVFLVFLAALISFGQRSEMTRSITIVTEPGAIVWIDDLRYGQADSSGRFTVDPLPAGPHKIRVRADGFRETVKPISAVQQGEVSIGLTKTTDQAELTFQEAERLTTLDREAAAAAYRKAIKLRPRYTQAYTGLIRVLSDARDRTGAMAAIRDLRKISPRNAEASAMEGRLHKENDDEENAIASFKRAIPEGRGMQPEAYTGLGLLYKERAEHYGAEGDAENEKVSYEQAVTNMKMALKQLGTAPDALVLYQLLGLVYERQDKHAEAIELYKQALRNFPKSNEATAFASFIEQLQKKHIEN